MPTPYPDGWFPDRDGIDAWLADPFNALPEFADAIGGLPRRREPVLLYESVIELHPEWLPINQGAVGSCVGVGYSHAVTVLQACDIVMRGEPELWPGPACPEAIYGGSRVEARGRRTNRGGDGSYGAAACKWLRSWGAIAQRDYSGQTRRPDHDVRTYSAARAKRWGAYGNGGRYDRGRLDLVARQHPVKTTAMVRNFKEAAAAIANGYPVPVCSGQGFSRTRDRKGFCRAWGSWSHCMCFIGVRFDTPGLLCLNSWGNHAKGPVWPATMPDNLRGRTFWVHARTADKMLARRDSYALSGFAGYESQDVGIGLRKFRQRRKARRAK